MTLPIREQALVVLQDLFTAMGPDLPADDPYTVQFDVVQRNPLDDTAWKKRLCLGIHDTLEVVANSPGLKNRLLTVVLEIRRVLDTGEVASTVGGEIISNMQRLLALNYNLNSTVIDVVETSTELYIEDFDKRQLSGAMFIKVQYRTAQDDPRRNR